MDRLVTTMPSVDHTQEPQPGARSVRAACAMLAASQASIRAASVTVRLDEASGAARDLAQMAKLLAGEFGLRHRVEVVRRVATVHLWREP